MGVRPPHRPRPPEGRRSEWIADPIDAFVLAKLEAKGLYPAPPADRANFYPPRDLDLHGLPPTPEEIDAFVGDPAADPKAYETLIDRLLASPRYGERWGRHWLDVRGSPRATASSSTSSANTPGAIAISGRQFQFR